MTIIEAINHIDTMKPNNYNQSDKIKWLSNLDSSIKAEIIDTHEGGEGIVFNGYDENTPLDTELLVPSPYDDVYPMWLESRIDYTNGEYAKYNNSNAMYLTAYAAYERYYNRNHMPKGNQFHYF